MSTRILGVLGLALLGVGPAVAAQQPAQPARPATDQHATVTKYCVSCHNDRAKAGGLALDTLDVNNPSAAAGAWEKSIKKLRVGMMPPQGMPQPDAATRASLVSWLTTTLDKAAATKPNPGR